MTIILYDLAGAEPDRRFSPYCWRTRMALAHKGLETDARPWRFTEKDAIAGSGQDKVPVIVDGQRTVSDSWKIALYLEEAYPDRPSLFGGPAGRALTRFYNDWSDGVMLPGMIRLVVADIHSVLHPKDQEYFRTTREKRLGMSLEQVAADRDERVLAFRAAMAPLRQTLSNQPFLGGERPLYADYAAFGGFQWVRCVSAFQLLEPTDPIYAWRGRLLDAFDGLAGKSKGFDC